MCIEKHWGMRCVAFLIFSFSHFLIFQAWAQTLTGRAPSQVAVGEQFRLSYTINTQDVRGFRAGRIPDGFEVLMGPSTSTQSSFQMVNGHTSSTSSVTYTYILVANKNGTFTIGKASRTMSWVSSPSDVISGSSITVEAAPSVGDGTITYSSSDTTKATVNGNVVSGVGVGSVILLFIL